MTIEQILATKNVLSRGRYTMDALAKRLKCSRPAAERRVGELKRLSRGAKNWALKTEFVRTGLRGPPSKAYFVE